MTTNIVVLIALSEEYDVFKAGFPPDPDGDVSTSTLVRTRHQFEHDGFTLTSVLASDMGADAAIDSLYSAIQDLDPDLVVCLGIAGSLSDDARLGERVCIEPDNRRSTQLKSSRRSYTPEETSLSTEQGSQEKSHENNPGGIIWAALLR